MSIENAEGFISRVKEDRGFREKIEKSNDEERTLLAKTEGFDFTREELIQAMDGALDDEALDQVAGGGCGSDCHDASCQSAQNCTDDCPSQHNSDIYIL